MSNPVSGNFVKFDLSRLRVDGDLPRSPVTCTGVKRRRIKGRFLKGPIPWSWVGRAMKLRGKAFHIGIILWQEAGYRKSRSVNLRMSAVDKVGFSRRTAKRALRELEAADLVKIDRKPGQLLQVEILEVEE
jgi:hypothetical protein